MVHRLGRFLLPLSCVLALAAVPATAAAKLVVGISDNSPSMFSNRYFKQINLTTARDMVDWNVAVMRNKTLLHETAAWIGAAEADGVTPMISFQGNGNFVPPTKVYTAAIKAFIHDFPEVKLYSPWNEPDWVYRPRLAKNPRLAASYFNALAQNCHRCTVVAGDLYLPTPQLGRWIRAYKRWLHPRPAIWALHNYYDVRTHTTKQLREMESLLSGQIWLTEISGVERRGHWQFRNQSSAAAARDEKFLFSLPARFHRLTRIYHYQWQGENPGRNTGWDSGLLSPSGAPRPAYSVVAKAAGRRR